MWFARLELVDSHGTIAGRDPSLPKVPSRRQPVSFPGDYTRRLPRGPRNAEDVGDRQTTALPSTGRHSDHWVERSSGQQ